MTNLNPAQKTIKLACPICQSEQEVQVYDMLDLGRNPQKKLGILTDSFFTFTCKQCKSQFSITYEILCLNKEAGYAVLLAPDFTQGEIEAPKELQSSKLRVVTTVNQLKEKILLFEELYDDAVIELCKLYLIMENSLEDATLLFTEHREGQLVFSVFDEDNQLQNTIQAPDALYTRMIPPRRKLSINEGKFIMMDTSFVFDQIAR
ncbi:MAG: CpXC domain-containing protein [Sphaerochaetaceae bacterium]